MSFFKETAFRDSFKKIDDDFFPQACLIDNDIFLNKNGDIGQVIEFEIEDFRLNQEDGFRKYLVDSISQYAASLDIAVWIHTIKKERNSSEAQEIRHNSYFLQNLKERYTKKERLLNNHSIVTCVTIIKRGPNIKPSVFGLFTDLDNNFWSNIEIISSELRDICLNIVKKMDLYSPRILTSYSKNDLSYSELISFFGYFANLSTEEYPIADISIDKQINNSKFKIQNSQIEIKNEMNSSIKEIAIFSLKEKSSINIKTLQDIINIPSEMIISEYFEYINFEKGEEIFQDQISLLDSIEDESFLKKTGLNFIKEQENFLIKSSISFVFINDNKIKSSLLYDFIDSKFKEYGLLAIKEDISCASVFYSIFPGNFKFNRRLTITGMRDFAFFAYSYTPSLPNLDLFWKSKIFFKLSSLKSNPISFGVPIENQNIVISGPNLSGKTVLANFISSILKYELEDVQIYSIDLSSKSSSFFSSISGKYYQVSMNKTFNTAFFNPLNLSFVSIEEKERIISEVLLLLISASNTLINSKIIEDVKDISKQISISSEMTLYKFRGLFKEKELDIHLDKWHSIGSHYYLFDNKQDLFLQEQDNSIGIYLDHTIQKEQQLLNLIVFHILNQIILKKTDKIKVVILDEPFLLFKDIFFRSKIQNIINLAAKNNVIFIFKIENFLLRNSSSNSFTSIINSSTVVHFGNQKVNIDYQNIFSLEKYQTLTINNLSKINHAFLFHQGSFDVSATLNLSGCDNILNILSDNFDTRNQILNIKEDIQSDDPRRWLPIFYKEVEIQTDDMKLEFDIKSELNNISKSQELMS